MKYNLLLLFYCFVALSSALFMYYLYTVLLKPSTPQTNHKIVAYASGRMKKLSGFTLIELIIFIVGLGILASTILLPLAVSLRSSPKGFNTLAAFEVAKGRMELIRMQSRVSGFANTQDICAIASSPAVCTASTPAGYTVTSVISAAPSPNNDTTKYKQVTVTVTGNSTLGNSYAELISIIANY